MVSGLHPTLGSRAFSSDGSLKNEKEGISAKEAPRLSQKNASTASIVEASGPFQGDTERSGTFNSRNSSVDDVVATPLATFHSIRAMMVDEDIRCAQEEEEEEEITFDFVVDADESPAVNAVSTATTSTLELPQGEDATNHGLPKNATSSNSNTEDKHSVAVEEC